MEDKINSPGHYTYGKIECIDYIESLGLGEGFCKGNAIKYITRAGHKENAVEDLKKAKWYIDRLIACYEKEQKCVPCTEKEEKTWEVGDTLFFGRYPQEADGTVKAVEWRILKIEDGIAACISKYGLDASCFDKSGKYRGYENSTLSEKVDDMFCQMFNGFEELCMEGNILDDKGYSAFLYILSKEEAEELFDSDEDRECKPTPYAVKRGVYRLRDDSCRWWLRTQACCATTANNVGINGIIEWHSNVINASYTVRPAMKLDLEAFNRMTKEKEGI